MSVENIQPFSIPKRILISPKSSYPNWTIVADWRIEELRDTGEIVTSPQSLVWTQKTENRV